MTMRAQQSCCPYEALDGWKGEKECGGDDRPARLKEQGCEGVTETGIVCDVCGNI